ncbi:MAG: AI-2E family transporter [Coriobacteriales bacterium]|jgi:predicted PurR-regulated permease PerM
MEPRGNSSSASVATSNGGKKRSSVDVKFKRVWLIIGIGVIVVAVAFAIGSIADAIWAIIVAALVVFIFKNLVEKLQKRGIPRAVSSAVLVILLALVIIAILVSFVPMIQQQVSDLVNQLPTYIDQLQTWLNEFTSSNSDSSTGSTAPSIMTVISDMLGNLSNSTDQDLAGNIYKMGVSAISVIVYGVTAFIVAFWVLLDYNKIASEIHALSGRTVNWYVTLFATILSRVFGGYIKGTIIGAIIIAIISGIGYFLIGLPYPVVLGLLAGMMSIVPYIGPIITTIIVALLGLFVSPIAAILSIFISVLVPWLIGSFVSPRVMSATVNLHPAISLVSIIIGGILGGPGGMILAIPVVATIKCIFIFFFEAMTGRQLVTENGALFMGHPSDPIDPVFDCTDGFISRDDLSVKVDVTQSKVKSSGPVATRKFTTVMRDITHPVPSSASGGEADVPSEAGAGGSDSMEPGAAPDVGDAAAPGAEPDSEPDMGDAGAPGSEPEAGDAAAPVAEPGAQPDVEDAAAPGAEPGSEPEVGDFGTPGAAPGSESDVEDSAASPTEDNAASAAEPDAASDEGNGPGGE